ncbi:hypothetical protein PQX77_015417 [Marasmius sp. AFHP31]|nr:hypothetical protein PQX77_015417 [Marasmius sp. AFHP31]
MSDAKLLITPQGEPLGLDAAVSFMKYLSNEGLQSETVRSSDTCCVFFCSPSNCIYGTRCLHGSITLRPPMANLRIPMKGLPSSMALSIVSSVLNLVIGIIA